MPASAAPARTPAKSCRRSGPTSTRSPAAQPARAFVWMQGHTYANFADPADPADAAARHRLGRQEAGGRAGELQAGRRAGGRGGQEAPEEPRTSDFEARTRRRIEMKLSTLRRLGPGESQGFWTRTARSAICPESSPTSRAARCSPSPSSGSARSICTRCRACPGNPAARSLRGPRGKVRRDRSELLGSCRRIRHGGARRADRVHEGHIIASAGPTMTS